MPNPVELGIAPGSPPKVFRPVPNRFIGHRIRDNDTSQTQKIAFHCNEPSIGNPFALNNLRTGKRGQGPFGGCVFYAEGAALKWRGSSGTVTTITP